MASSVCMVIMFYPNSRNRILNELLDPLQEAGGRCAVHQAMVKHQAKRPHLAGNDLPIANDRFGLDATHAQDGCLGQVDDGREGVDLVHAQAGDGEGPAAQIVGQRLARPRPIHQGAEFGAKGTQPHLVSPADNGNQQPALGVDGHAKVDVGQSFDGLAIIAQAGIHVGKLAQRPGDDQAQKVVVPGGKTPFLRNRGLELLSTLDERGSIGFGNQGDPGGSQVAGGHTLGDDAPQAGHRLMFDGLRFRSRQRGAGDGRCRGRLGYVGLHNPAAYAAAGDGDQVDTQRFRGLLGHGRGLGQRCQVVQHVLLDDPALWARAIHQGQVHTLFPSCFSGAG